MSRRSYVKRAVVATGVLGGIVGGSQSAAAAENGLWIEGQGDYIVVVSDETVERKGSLEPDDDTFGTANGGQLVGSVDGDQDEIGFDGYVTYLSLDGDLTVGVYGDHPAPNGDVVVEGSNTAYAFTVTHSAQTTSDCESTESAGGTSVSGQLGWSDTDTFDVIGAIDGAATFSADAQVTIDYQT